MSGWNRARIIGTGTLLDSARFRFLLSQHCGIDVHNIHAYILGEHGDSEVAAWSMTNIAGIPIDEYCPVCGRCNNWNAKRLEIEETVRNYAYHIINYKGATYYAISLVLVRIVGAILRNEMSVLIISSVLDGEYGLKDISLGVPCVISKKGIKYVLEAKLSQEELRALHNSASILKNVIKELEGSW